MNDTTVSIPAAFVAAGFALPPQRWTKTDPRGHEYGYYEACIVPPAQDTGDSHILVNKFSRTGHADWQLHFYSTEFFMAWAADQT